MRKICSYFGNIYPQVFKAHADEIKASGFDTIVLCMSDDLIEWNLENLTEFVKIAKNRRLDVWADPWAVGGLFDGEALSSYDGASCLRHMSTIHIINWLGRVVQTGCQAIFWDNPRAKCLCGCNEDLLPHIMRRLFIEAKSHKMRNYICLSGGYTSNQNFDKIASYPELDGIGTDPYCLCDPAGFDFEDHVRKHAKHIVALSQKYKLESHIWTQGFGLKEGYESYPTIAAKIAESEGIQGIAFWGFRSCEAISKIRPKKYQRIWDEVSKQ